MTTSHQVDKEWFLSKLRERNASVRKLARHMDLDASAVSRMFSNQRRMQMDEATDIANFLGVPVSEVLRHAGVSRDLDGRPTRILLAATINERGILERLSDPRPLPQSVIDRAHNAIADAGNGKVIAAQVRADTGPLALWDDAVILFRHTDRVENDAIGTLAICRASNGEQMLAKIERARKTGEARAMMTSGKSLEFTLETATPILAIIP